MREDGSYTGDEESLILDHALIPAPLGSYGDYGKGMDPYNNAVVYWLAFLTVFVVILAPAALGVAIYRIVRERPHAWRGFWVAVGATVVGVALVVAALSAA